MPTVNNWKTLAFRVRFLTPAFLGDAEQKGRWRTPPFKALLRQWWRVAYAAQEGYRGDIARMREVEGKLFGNAWLDKQSGKAKEADFCKSLVRLRLSRWEAGQLTLWPSTAPQEQIVHPELTRPAGGRISPYLYLGYGPLDDRNGLARSPAIAPGEQTTLALAFPAENAELIEAAVALMHLYGTVGGRSRNGWGSFVIEGPGERRWDGLSRLPIRTWKEALVLDWPHAIGKDDTGPLIWQTGEYDDWREVMRALAIVRLGVRTQFVFSSAPPHPAPQPRHWLSYPITRHNCESWNNQLRLPNSLRFKVRPSPQNPDRFVGIIFHIPCLPPPNFRPQRDAIMDTWQTVHKLLDQMSNRPSQRKYESIQDPDRRKKLKPWLDKVHLKRIER
jgi:CRISPR-associated protein Cmr1